MKLYFVRHGQSFGNVDGEYDQSLAGALTELGERQAAELAPRLAPFSFDAIITSPLERTVRTILPYLKETSQTAEAWPELVECRGRKDVDDPAPSEVRHGEPVALPEGAEPAVRLRTDEPAGTHMPPPGEIYAEGCRRARLAAERIVETWGGTDATVLLVGHACNGARVLESLLGIALDGRFQHHNTGMTFIEQKQDGDFIMRFMNRIPDAYIAELA